MYAYYHVWFIIIICVHFFLSPSLSHLYFNEQKYCDSLLKHKLRIKGADIYTSYRVFYTNKYVFTAKIKK